MAEEKKSRIYDIGIVPYRAELAERILFPFSQLNYLTNGGILDRLTLITSSTDNGKTTLASQIICDCIKQGYKVAADFGEDTGTEASERIYKQFTTYNRDNYIPLNYEQNGKKTNVTEYFLTKAKWDEAHDFFAEKLFIYNTLCTHDIDNILGGFTEAFNLGCRVFVLDNMENVEYDGDNENKRFKDIAIALRNFAIKKKVHIIVVAHIRKMEREVIVPTLDDVKGSSAVSNTAKNVIAIIRTDKIDKEDKPYKRLQSLCKLNNYDVDKADAVLFVLKTKGKKLGLVCLNYNTVTNTYYEIGKIDEKKVETDKAILHAPKTQQMSIEDTEDGDLPF